MTQTEKALFALLHKSIDPDWECNPTIFTNVDWNDVFLLSKVNSVSFIAFDALVCIPEEYRPEKEITTQWYGELAFQELEYERKWSIACKLARLWAKENISATIIKGRSIAQFYPIPSHRYSCDLDVFIEDGWDKACSMLQNKGIKLEYEVYKEVEFWINGVYVECHRYITPVRGNKNMYNFELYLRSLLDSEKKTCFDGSSLIKPPALFTVLLCIEHALTDFLNGELSLKHIVDWMVLRKQNVDWKLFNNKCDEFKFNRFVDLFNSMADVIEGKVEYDKLPKNYKKAFDEIMQDNHKSKGEQSWFERRVDQFFAILNSHEKFANFGYRTMTVHLYQMMWAHFFNKEVKI